MFQNPWLLLRGRSYHTWALESKGFADKAAVQKGMLFTLFHSGVLLGGTGEINTLTWLSHASVLILEVREAKEAQ